MPKTGFEPVTANKLAALPLSIISTEVGENFSPPKMTNENFITVSDTKHLITSQNKCLILEMQRTGIEPIKKVF